MTARKLIDKLFGVRTKGVENPVVSSVGTSAVEVLHNNPSRLAWLIINMSSNTVYVAFERDVSSSKGVILQANGGFTSVTVSEDFDLVTYAVWAVASGAASAIYVLGIEEY